MSRKWLFLDCSFLFNRHFYALKHVPDHKLTDQILYNFFRDIAKLQERHDTSYVAFCFDRSPSLRLEVLPTYKSTRQFEHDTQPRKVKKRRTLLHELIRKIRREYLPEIGFRNIFSQNGYEGDDIIASLCHHTLEDKDRAIIVTADQDFYQLLAPNISLWHPIKQHLLTFARFRRDWQLEPEQWAMVKTLAGCSSDDIPGIKGVGEKTAAQFVSGRLHPDNHRYAIIEKGLKLLKKNMPLVKLPFQGVNKFKFKKDTIDKKTWKAFAKRMKIKSLFSLEFCFHD